MSDQTLPPQDHPEEGVEKVNRAIAELVAKQEVFSRETYTQLLLALYDKRRVLQTQQSEQHPLLADDTQEDEIRLVTVMFIDVMKSTEIAEAIGFENWRMLIGDLHRRFADTITRWGGEVGQYLGDGLLCFFGARRSRGNDTAQAVSCALALQDRAAEYYFEVQKEYDVESFFVRIGLSTGRVVVGTIGTEDKSETLAMGTTTNLAARLQAVCPPGGIVVDSETHLRTRSDFHFIAHDPVNLKGFTDPAPYFQVMGTQHQTLTHLTSNRIGDIPIPFIGRQEQVERISQVMKIVEQDGQFAMVLLYGDTGIGKSRLLQEVATSPATKPFFVLRMVGHYERRETPFSLLRDMIAALCDLSDALTIKAIEERIIQYTQENWDSPNAEAAAAVVGYMSGYGFKESAYTQSLTRSSSATNDNRRYRWMVRWARGIANDRPLLLLVDNLQWADPDSLQLLHYLGQNETNLMILAASRPEFRTYSKPYFGAVPYQEITLYPMSEADTRQILDDVLQHIENVPAELKDVIIERAEGNPLFVEEFLRMLFDNGVFQLRDEDDQWQVNSFQYHLMQDHLPNGLLGLFQARLDDLPPADRRVIQAAAVVGQTFWDAAVNNIIGLDATDRLQNLVSRGIVVEHPESRFDNTREYYFRNSLYHDVAYSMLPRSFRVSSHQQVAHWLAGITTTNPAALSLLAHHYTHSEKPLEGVQTYLAAAAYSYEQGQLGETVNLIENGLKVGGNLTREQALPFASRLWLLKGRVAHSRRRYSEATADCQTALMLMKELDPQEMVIERVQASVTLGNAYTSLGHYEESVEALTSSYQLVDMVDDPTEQATVLRAFGQLYWARGSLSEAELYQRRAQESAQESDNIRELAATRYVLGRILLDQGSFPEALAIFEDVYQMNRQAHHLLYQASDLRMLATVYRFLFAYEKAQQVIDTSSALSKRISYALPMLLMTQGMVYISQGEHEKGIACLREAVEKEYDDTHERYNVQLAFLRGLAQTGHAEECLQEAELFITNIQSHTPVLYGRGLLWVGLAQYQLGQAQAEKTLRWSLDNEKTYGGRDVWMCQYALGLATADPTWASHYRQQARETLRQIADSLEATYPALAARVKDPASIQTVFRNWMHDDAQIDA